MQLLTKQQVSKVEKCELLNVVFGLQTKLNLVLSFAILPC